MMMNEKAELVMSPRLVAIADPMVSMIERVVMDPTASLDKLERMLAMKERLDATNARKAFDHAISAAKAEIPPIIKSREVDFTGNTGKRTHYHHEDMAGIARVVDPILGKFGLSYRYRTTQRRERQQEQHPGGRINDHLLAAIHAQGGARALGGARRRREGRR
jgi:hypothetical protein